MSWTDREILVCLLNVMEHSNIKLEYAPPSRNANGFRQKINALKRELQPEFESIKAGNPVDSTPKKKVADGGAPKGTGTPRKRKAAVDEDGEGTPKKRGRPRKTEVVEEESETVVKDEAEGEPEIEEEI